MDVNEKGLLFLVRAMFVKLFSWMDNSDRQKLQDAIFEDVVKDVLETADKEGYNSDDVQIAIRRAIFNRMGIE